MSKSSSSFPITAVMLFPVIKGAVRGNALDGDPLIPPYGPGNTSASTLPPNVGVSK